MKNNKFKEITNKKGFMIAIYSCAAIVIAMTGIIASNREGDEQARVDETRQAQVEEVNQSDVKSYLENQITGNGALDADSGYYTENSENNNEKTSESRLSEKSTTEDNQNNQNNQSSNNDTTEKTTESNESAKTEFTLFDDSKEMSWPLEGQIVMDYSMETAIYDKTLDQYSTNDSLCIAGTVGDDIKASADGKVISVFNDKENLTSVVIEHGNGWLSTYSQLQDNVLVKEGDIVDEGAVIGNLAEPSYKSSSLGPHLEFKVMNNDTCTDPKIILSQEE